MLAWHSCSNTCQNASFREDGEENVRTCISRAREKQVRLADLSNTCSPSHVHIHRVVQVCESRCTPLLMVVVHSQEPRRVGLCFSLLIIIAVVDKQAQCHIDLFLFCLRLSEKNNDDDDEGKRTRREKKKESRAHGHSRSSNATCSFAVREENTH